MKVIIATIAALGAISSFTGAAIADVSISIRFGSSPSHNTYRNYDSYRSIVHQSAYPVPYYQNPLNHPVAPSHITPLNYPYSLNHPVAPSYVIPSNHPYSTIRSNVYNPYNVDLGDRYIIQQRIIRVR